MCAKVFLNPLLNCFSFCTGKYTMDECLSNHGVSENSHRERETSEWDEGRKMESEAHAIPKMNCVCSHTHTHTSNTKRIRNGWYFCKIRTANSFFFQIRTIVLHSHTNSSFGISSYYYLRDSKVKKGTFIVICCSHCRIEFDSVDSLYRRRKINTEHSDAKRYESIFDRSCENAPGLFISRGNDIEARGSFNQA